MTPRNDLASTTYCLADPGQEYVVYAPPGKKDFTVELAAGSYALEWFDPTTGQRVRTDELIAALGSRSFNAPGDGGAVLFLKKIHQTDQRAGDAVETR
jgi:hypothetical protein